MNFKVRCTKYIKDATQQFTEGKVYEVKNDVLISDANYEFTAWALPMNGNGDFEALKKWFARYYVFELVEEKKVVNDKIVITHDGKTTTATLYKADGSKEKATARCAPEDTFDFNFGANLAMERLMEKVEPKTVESNVKGNNVKFKTGDYAVIIDCKCGHEFKIGTIVRLEKLESDYKAYTDDDFWFVVDDELEAYTPPKYYNGKVVCVANEYEHSIPINCYTIGKIYEVVDGVITGDDGWKCIPEPTLEKLCIGVGNKFIPLVE